MDKCVQMLDKELWRLGPDGSGKRKDGRERGEREEEKRTERLDGKRKGRRRKKRGKRVGERERGARLVCRKGLSPEIGVKQTMNAGGVQNRID
ncbi:hypothetical protein TNCV_29181 [Trichonephila clavipes]|nr:hypothetical protein TNCV_29181 [Trichonephila clavipes]